MDLGDLLNLVPMAAVIVPLVAVGIVLITVVVVLIVVAKRMKGVRSVPQMSFGALVNQVNRAIAAGEKMPQQAEVEHTGWTGEARILDVNELESVSKNRFDTYYRGALVLEVHLPDTPPYRAPCEQWFIGSQWLGVRQGELLPVRVHRQNPQLVFIDEAARRQAHAHAEEVQRQEHAKRQADLLAGRR